MATSLSPSTAPVGSSPIPLVITGSNFSTDSAVEINGTRLLSSFVSTTQVSAMVPASYMANIGTSLIAVTTPAPGGGRLSSLVLTVVPTDTLNLTQTGSIIARVTAPTGGGSRSLEVIRDGDTPAVGSPDARRQYDTYRGGAVATDDWIGYQYTTPQTFAAVIFQEGV